MLLDHTSLFELHLKSLSSRSDHYCSRLGERVNDFFEKHMSTSSARLSSSIRTFPLQTLFQARRTYTVLSFTQGNLQFFNSHLYSWSLAPVNMNICNRFSSEDIRSTFSGIRPHYIRAGPLMMLDHKILVHRQTQGTSHN